MGNSVQSNSRNAATTGHTNASTRSPLLLLAYNYSKENCKEERWKEEQAWLEDRANQYDPYDGDEPPDLSEGDAPEEYVENDYSGYNEEGNEQHEIDKQLKANKIAEDSGKIPYKKILSSEWVADYRKNPPASSFQELGDFSSYDEFKIKMNSLIVDLSKKNDFQSESYQKLFDYLSLRDVFNLIQNNAY